MKVVRWRNILTRETAARQLRDLGISPEDTVVVHSSLRAIGPVEGGGEGLLELLRAYFDRGLLLVPTHTWATVQPSHPYYNAAVDQPCIGALPALAAFHPGGVRSLHPTHSMTAFGSRAAEYVRDEELTGTPAPPEGCWGRLYGEQAKILLLGVGQERNTYLHAVEEMLRVPDRLTDTAFTVYGTDGKGYFWEQTMRRHHCTQAPDISREFPRYLPAFLYWGAVWEGRFGAAQAQVCDARGCFRVMENIRRKLPEDQGVGPLPEACWRESGTDSLSSNR